MHIKLTDSPVIRWNVYHILAVYNTAPHLQLLDHILKKLPEDVSARMLTQQSKKAFNTVSINLHLISSVRSPF